MPINPDAWLGRLTADSRLSRLAGPLASVRLGRPFTPNARHRVQIYWTRSRIAFAQVYPFLRYAAELRRREGIEIRCTPIEALLSGDFPPVAADTVLVQPWFTVNRASLIRALGQVRVTSPAARVVLLDPCAHNDLRLARDVDPFIDLYVKKSLFRDRACYFAPTMGDTNLTDYFGPRFGCPEARVDWHVPDTILPKLRVGPGFVTAPGLWEAFLRAPPDFREPRPIDLHARLATQGTGWYAAMRQDAEDRSRSLSGQNVTGSGVSHRAFMHELRHAKMVFSPFGYGELCWRDIEGFLTGAVVVKQDMSHLQTQPDLFRPWETYVPVSWDLSDLPGHVARVRHDAGLRSRIATNAWRAVRTYLETALYGDLHAVLTEQISAPAATRVAKAAA